MASRALPSLLLAAAIVLWATTYRATAIGTAHAPALVFGAARTVPTAILLLALLGRGVGRLRLRTLLGLVVSGWFMVTVFIYALSEGVARAGAANTAVLLNTTPLLVAAAAPAILHERLTPRGALAVVGGFAGVVLLFASQLHLAGGAVAVGLALALVGAAAWAVGVVIVKRMTQRDSSLGPLAVVAVQYAAGSPVLVAIALAVHGTSDAEWHSGTLWAALLYVAGAAAAGTFCYFGALRALPATHVTTAQFLIPVVAVAIEIGRGAAPDRLSLLGIGLTLVSVAVVTTGLARSESRTDHAEAGVAEHEVARPLP